MQTKGQARAEGVPEGRKVHVLSNSPPETQVEFQVLEDLEAEVTMFSFPPLLTFSFSAQSYFNKLKVQFKKKLKGRFCTFGLENPYHFPEAINEN